MPRKSRIDAPGSLHHIIIRGIERRWIFRDSQDYANFIKRLGNVLAETETPCFAWTLMSTHVHLLLRTGRVSISTLMRRLLTGYAQQFNRRHRRHGQLFQNRFKSILCEEAYLSELVRYIHLNPLRAGMVRDADALETYPYTGHGVILGKQQYEWQDVEYVLRGFGQTVGAARRAYKSFVAEGIGVGRSPELEGGGLIRSAGGWVALKELRSQSSRIMGDERFLGSGAFVERALKEAEEKYEFRTYARARGVDTNDVIRVVSDYFGVEPGLIKGIGKQRNVSRARAIVCTLVVERLGLRGREVARKLEMSPSAVSKALLRGRLDTRTEGIWKEMVKLDSKSP